MSGTREITNVSSVVVTLVLASVRAARSGSSTPVG